MTCVRYLYDFSCVIVKLLCGFKNHHVNKPIASKTHKNFYVTNDKNRSTIDLHTKNLKFYNTTE